MEVRKGTQSDAAALSRLASETFCDSFGHLYTPTNLKTYLESAYTEQLQLVELQNANIETLLAVEDGRVIGYVMLRLGNREAQIKGPDPVVEVWRLYVDKRYIGKGVAHLLMKRVMEAAKEHKAAVLWLGVWENNLRAQKFYKKYGFQVVGTHDFVIGAHVDTDLLFQINLYEQKQND